MSSATFCEPIHLGSINRLHEIPGVYIWGFIREKKGESFIDFLKTPNPIFDPKEHQFIPYYVGETDNLRKRIQEHSLLRSMDAAKYVRFDMGFMNEFYLHVPRQYGRNKYYGSDYITINGIKRNSIVYYPAHDVMTAIYGKKIPAVINNSFSVRGKKTLKKQSSISEIDSIIGINDTLWELTNTMNNFWFMSLDLPHLSIQPKDNKEQRADKRNDRCSYEKKVYLSIKGGTISRFVKDAKDQNVQIIDNSNTDIFHLKNNELDYSSVHYDGNFKEKNKRIPY
jgi:hypothetical protein